MARMTHLLEVLRRKGYWLMDLLEGKSIRNNYNEITKVLRRGEEGNPDEAHKSNLERLLRHATLTTPFYQKFQNYTKLQDFPIIDKNLILDHYQDFKSTTYSNAKLFKASSSGSTGIPFSVYQDKGKRDRNTADVIYFTEQAEGNVGNKFVYIKLWDHTNQKNQWVSFLQNILKHNVMDSSKEDIQKLISKLEKDKSTKTILGYPSFFEELCNYLDSANRTPKVANVSSVISFAESLKDYERIRMSKYFDAPVYERYSNQENGILAQQTKTSNGNYALNWASYHFEILQLDSNKHVKSGELGRVVVTDLFNLAMPMIRYDTGDMAVYEEPKNGFPYLSKIYGRRMDTIYNTKGEIVSPFIFYLVLDFSKIRQFQFKQKGKNEYTFVLNGKPADVAEREIIDYFKRYLGDDAVITFEYVEEIPLLSSGKRKKIVNEYFAHQA